MRELEIDLETRSGADLKYGVYRYVEDPDFALLLLGYAFGDDPVRVVDLAHGEPFPEEVRKALTDEETTVWAFNSQFERVCLSRYLGLPEHTYLPPEKFKCTMTLASMCGLPMSLKEVGRALALPEQKLDCGTRLISRFSDPPFELPPADDPDYLSFIEYNRRDVEVQHEIRRRVEKLPVPDSLWQQFWDSERINDRGVGADPLLARQALALYAEEVKGLTEQFKTLTGITSANSIPQMKAWLNTYGVHPESLNKKDVEALLRSEDGALPGIVRTALELRQQTAKTSIKKYETVLSSLCSDGRIRGMFRYYGAGRSGRFASKGLQLHNLPKNSIPDLDEVRAQLLRGDFAALRAHGGSVTDLLSQLIRTCFMPQGGGQFLVADESAVEARILSWLSGQRWRIEAFAAGDDIYCKCAEQMFGVPVVKHGVNGELRAKGKIAELALGYGGNVPALIRMGALEQGLKEEELPGLVDAWRSANPCIVRLWAKVHEAACSAITYRGTVETHGLRFTGAAGLLSVRLPSGRELRYLSPQVVPNGEDRDGNPKTEILFHGPEKGKWMPIRTYGAKLTENVVQGIARDILCEALGRLREAPVVMHVHDEIIVEDDGSVTLAELERIMGESPSWAQDLLLRADGYTTEFYRKD